MKLRGIRAIGNHDLFPFEIVHTSESSDSLILFYEVIIGLP